MTKIYLKIALAELLLNNKEHGALVWPDPFQNQLPCFMLRSVEYAVWFWQQLNDLQFIPGTLADFLTYLDPFQINPPLWHGSARMVPVAVTLWPVSQDVEGTK